MGFKMRLWGSVLLICSVLAFRAIPDPILGQAATVTAPAAKATSARHLPLKGVSKFGEVTPMLYRGGQPSSAGFARLAKFGINIVVDSGRSEKNKKLVEKLGMRYVSFSWHCPLPKDKVFAAFLKLVQDNPDKKIFVHCRFGDARTGMMIAAYRMKVQGWTADEALAEMRAYGFHGLHCWVCPGLTSYEKSFPDHLKQDPVFQDIH